MWATESVTGYSNRTTSNMEQMVSSLTITPPMQYTLTTLSYNNSQKMKRIIWNCGNSMGMLHRNTNTLSPVLPSELTPNLHKPETTKSRPPVPVPALKPSHVWSTWITRNGYPISSASRTRAWTSKRQQRSSVAGLHYTWKSARQRLKILTIYSQTVLLSLDIVRRSPQWKGDGSK